MLYVYRQYLNMWKLDPLSFLVGSLEHISMLLAIRFARGMSDPKTQKSHLTQRRAILRVESCSFPSSGVEVWRGRNCFRGASERQLSKARLGCAKDFYAKRSAKTSFKLKFKTNFISHFLHYHNYLFILKTKSEKMHLTTHSSLKSFISLSFSLSEEKGQQWRRREAILGWGWKRRQNTN